MNVKLSAVSGWVGSLYWPLVRVAGMVMVAPVLGGNYIPVRIRVGLSVLITMLIVPGVNAVPPVPALSAEGILITATQVLIGVAMGFIVQLVFAALVMAGEQMAFSMGLGFASIVDPQNGVTVPVVSQFFTLIATLLYLALDGHAVLIEVLVESFYTMPIAPIGLGADEIWRVVSWASEMFIGAVQIALPVVAAIMLVYLALGVMTRAAPQLNIFSVGFPLTMLVGFITMAIFMRAFLPAFEQMLFNGLSVTRQLVAG